MSYKQKIATKYVVAPLIMLIFFGAGEVAGSKWAILTIMQLQAEVLVRNGAILSECQKYGCSNGIQKLLIHENDSAMQQYEFWETVYLKSTSRIFYYTTWPVINYFTETDEFIVPTKNRINNYYDKLGCGLKNIICNQNTISKSG